MICLDPGGGSHFARGGDAEGALCPGGKFDLACLISG